MSIDQQDEFEKMKKIGTIVANCLALLKASARAGMSTKELDDIAGKYLESQGAISAPKSEYNFPGFVCLSLEKTVAHGVPDTTIIQRGDLLNIDVSAHLDGYYADNGESIVIGRGSTQKELLCKSVKKALRAGLRAAKAGCLISQVGKKVERIAKSHGLTVIKNLGGHGVGQSLHEEPEFIASYHNRKDKRVFAPNQVVAIEPFLSNGATWVKQDEDAWPLYHPEFYCAQKEHTVMITKDKPYIFTQPDRSFS